MKKHVRFQAPADTLPPETPTIRALAEKMMTDRVKILDSWLRKLGITEENIKEYEISGRQVMEDNKRPGYIYSKRVYLEYEVKKDGVIIGTTKI